MIPFIIYYWNGRILMRRAFPNAAGQPGIAKDERCCCESPPCCACPQFRLGANPDDINDLNVTISGAFNGSGTLDSMPMAPDECVLWEGTINPSDGHCGLNSLTITVRCPVGGESAMDFEMDVVANSGACQIKSPSAEVNPDSASCGPPFTGTWTFYTDDIIPGGCTCGEDQSITIVVTEAT